MSRPTATRAREPRIHHLAAQMRIRRLLRAEDREGVVIQLDARTWCVGAALEGRGVDGL